MDIRDGNAGQRAVVGGLPAPLGIERGTIQRHEIAAFAGLAGEDGSGKFPQKRVVIVEFYSFHVENFLSNQEMETTKRQTGSARCSPTAAEDSFVNRRKMNTIRIILY